MGVVIGRRARPADDLVAAHGYEDELSRFDPLGDVRPALDRGLEGRHALGDPLVVDAGDRIGVIRPGGANDDWLGHGSTVSGSG